MIRAKSTARKTDLGRLLDWFATSLGVGPERRDLSRSFAFGLAAGPRLLLQLLFAAGVATLGLALATGDLVLGLRAAAMLFS